MLPFRAAVFGLAMKNKRLPTVSNAMALSFDPSTIAQGGAFAEKRVD